MSDGACIYQLMVLTAISDGRLDPAEQSAAARMLRERPELRDIGDRPALARSARDLLAKSGLRAAVSEIAGQLVNPDARRAAVVCCGGMLRADGRMAWEEIEVMSQLRQGFGMSIEELERMIA